MGMGSSERIDADKRGELSLVYVLGENTIKGKMEPEPAGTVLSTRTVASLVQRDTTNNHRRLYPRQRHL